MMTNNKREKKRVNVKLFLLLLISDQSERFILLLKKSTCHRLEMYRAFLSLSFLRFSYQNKRKRKNKSKEN